MNLTVLRVTGQHGKWIPTAEREPDFAVSGKMVLPKKTVPSLERRSRHLPLPGGIMSCGVFSHLIPVLNWVEKVKSERWEISWKLGIGGKDVLFVRTSSRLFIH